MTQKPASKNRSGELRCSLSFRRFYIVKEEEGGRNCDNESKIRSVITRKTTRSSSAQEPDSTRKETKSSPGGKQILEGDEKVFAGIRNKVCFSEGKHKSPPQLKGKGKG